MAAGPAGAWARTATGRSVATAAPVAATAAPRRSNSRRLGDGRRGGCWGDGVTSVAWLDEDTDTSLSSWPFELPTMTCYLLLMIKMTGEFAALQVRAAPR